MITLTQKQQIIMRHLDGESNRQIASALHISKDTVNKYVNEYDAKRSELLAKDPDADPDEVLQSFVEQPKYDTRNRMPVKVTPEIRTSVAECLRLNAEKRASGRRKQEMRKTDIHEYLLQQGYDVSYSTVKRLTKEIETRCEEAFIRQEYSPGEICEFDWGEAKLNIGGNGYSPYQMAVFTPAYSGERFSILFPSQDTVAFQESHAIFFAFCRGSFHTMVYDNMRVAVRKFVGPTEKEPTQALLEMSQYYGFNFRFCNVRRGNEKGHVERSVDVVRHKAFSKPGDDCFESLEAANRHLRSVCLKLACEAASDGDVPADLFEKERAYLLPPMPKFESSIKTENSVDKYSTVVVAGNHYSVPDTLVGKRVQVRLYTSKLVIYYNDTIVAMHERSFLPHDWKINIYHYLRTLKRKPGALPGSTAMLQSDAVVKRIYDTYYTDDTKEFLEVLELAHEKGPDVVEAALKRLEQISPKDMSAQKVRIMCHSMEMEAHENETRLPRSDRLSLKAKSTLPQYDLLRKLQMEGGFSV